MDSQPDQPALLNEALADIRAELQALRADLAISRENCAPCAALPVEPEWVWVVLGRNPDDTKRVCLVAVTFSKAAAEAAVARIRRHERAFREYPYQLEIFRVRAGTNYLYGLDGAAEELI